MAYDGAILWCDKCDRGIVPGFDDEDDWTVVIDGESHSWPAVAWQPDTYDDARCGIAEHYCGQCDPDRIDISVNQLKLL